MLMYVTQWILSFLLTCQFRQNTSDCAQKKWVNHYFKVWDSSIYLNYLYYTSSRGSCTKPQGVEAWAWAPGLGFRNLKPGPSPLQALVRAGLGGLRAWSPAQHMTTQGGVWYGCHHESVNEEVRGETQVYLEGWSQAEAMLEQEMGVA